MRDEAAVQRILEERARALARPQLHIDIAQGEELVVFRLGDTRYAIPARSVREAYPLPQYVPLPGTPAFILGLVNVRGRLLTALDVRPLLDLPSGAPQTDALLLIICVKNNEVALLTDAVLDIQRRADDITPTPSSMAGHGTAWLYGVDHSFTMLIDPALLLADPRLIINMAS